MRSKKESEMTYRAINLLLALCLALFVVWGCGGTAPAVEEAAAEEQVDEEEPTAEPESAASADAEPEPVPEPEPPPPAAYEKPAGAITVKLETTKGDIIIDVVPVWAPKGAERFLELVRAGYYTDVAFFRVMRGFMAQTGVSGTPKLNKKWGNKRIKDDPVMKRNKRGMVTFAHAGPDSRTTQFFINLVDNTQLDASGFSVFGQVRDMTAADALYSGYGDGPPHGNGPDQNKIKKKGNKFLKEKFPELDYIISATIVEE
jgi:peptidyl-prolyl cis-trans isomerase A (cyclophilin A)